MDDDSKPSLLEPESRGGENAGRGFDFQDYFLVSQIPKLLEWDGFISLLREGISDVELKFYVPGYGENIELIEAKNHRLTPAIFWNEIERFYSVDKGSPETFRWFRLVATDLSSELAPLQNGLRRIRSPYGFYPEDSQIIRNSLEEFANIVVNAGKPYEYARFIFERVLIDTSYGSLQDNGEAIFRQNFGEYFSEYLLSHQLITSIYLSLLQTISRRNTPIIRKSIEDIIRSHIPADLIRPYLPIRLHTLHQIENVDEQRKLVLDWVKFFDRSNATYPSTDEWNIEIVERLLQVRAFILKHRNSRLIQVTGNRRLSATLAIGSVFSATSGFSIALAHRDDVLWLTNDHAGADEKDVLASVELPQSRGTDLVVSIGIPNNIRPAVENFLRMQDMPDLPFLNMFYLQPIANAREANALVAQIKTAIIRALALTGAKQIHLFVATPAFIALLLGHRLNATATIQCYEFIPPDVYVPTCTLRT